MGKSGKLGQALIGIVAEGKNGRAYLAPDLEQERIAFSEKPKTRPTQMQPDNPLWFSPPDYGMESFGDLFTDRQMIAVNTLGLLIAEVKEIAKVDSIRDRKSTRLNSSH